MSFISYPVLPEDSDGLTYKLPKIEEHAGKHPLVIIDDDVRTISENGPVKENSLH